MAICKNSIFATRLYPSRKRGPRFTFNIGCTKIPRSCQSAICKHFMTWSSSTPSPYYKLWHLIHIFLNADIFVSYIQIYGILRQRYFAQGCITIRGIPRLQKVTKCFDVDSDPIFSEFRFVKLTPLYNAVTGRMVSSWSTWGENLASACLADLLITFLKISCHCPQFVRSFLAIYGSFMDGQWRRCSINKSFIPYYGSQQRGAFCGVLRLRQ